MTKTRASTWLARGLYRTAALWTSFVCKTRTPLATDAYYVALGSSFAAGYGLGPRAPGSPFISRRGVNGYPQQVACLLDVPSFVDMSSSGSTVRHILRGGQMLLGPQIDAVGPDTRLVTLTAGGNDVGYIGDLVAMAYRKRGGMIGAAIGWFWKGAKPAGERDFAGLRSELDATLAEIRRRAPHARSIVVTYPAVLPAKDTCPALGITASEAALIREVGERLAQTMRAAAAAADATLVDMATLSIGHDACSTEPWVNGFEPRTGAAFHPTLAGASATASAIAEIVGGPHRRARS